MKTKSWNEKSFEEKVYFIYSNCSESTFLPGEDQLDYFEYDLQETLDYYEIDYNIRNGFQYAVRRTGTDTGHLCGYVEITPDLIDRIDIDNIFCHGGISYVDRNSRLFKETGSVVIGFDCLHSGDWSLRDRNGIYRDYQFVSNMCKLIIDQLEK